MNKMADFFTINFFGTLFASHLVKRNSIMSIVKSFQLVAVICFTLNITQITLQR